MTGQFTGTLALLRFYARRDRVRLPIWLGLLLISAIGSVQATKALYRSAADLVPVAAGVNDLPALVALYGRIYDPTSLGEVALFKMTGTGAVVVALLGALTVIRHTRAAEASGQTELLTAGCIGRLAPLAAASLLAAAACVTLGVGCALGLIALGLPAASAFAFGAAWGGVGLSFAGFAALAAQFPRDARSASLVCTAAMAGAYLARAVGDTASPTGPGWLTWVSPFGWAQQVRAFSDDRWAVALLAPLFFVVTFALAALASGHRDLADGFWAPRAGRPTASRALSGAFGLALRQSGVMLCSWAAGFALLGVVLGSVALATPRFLSSTQARDWIRQVGGASGLIDSYLWMSLGAAAMLASALGVVLAGQLARDEQGGRVTLVMAGTRSRARWWGAQTALIGLAVTAVQLIAGLGLGLAYGQAAHDTSQILRLLGAAAAHVPAALIPAAIALALYGLAPRWTLAAWGVLAASLLLSQLGPGLNLPTWLTGIAPFTHTPNPLTGTGWAGLGQHDTLRLLWLTAIAAAFVGFGLFRFGRRDLSES